MMLNRTKKLKKENKEIMKSVQYGGIKLEIEKLRDKVEIFND